MAFHCPPQEAPQTSVSGFNDLWEEKKHVRPHDKKDTFLS